MMLLVARLTRQVQRLPQTVPVSFVQFVSFAEVFNLNGDLFIQVYVSS